MKRKPLKKYNRYFDFRTEDYDSLTVSQLKQQADYFLRQYLLSSTENQNGWYTCPLTNKSLRENDLHVCHFIDRSHNCTRYDLRNCHLASAYSNTFESQIKEEGYKSLHHKKYKEFLILKYGKNIIEELLTLKNNFCIFAREDYISIIKKFRYER